MQRRMTAIALATATAAIAAIVIAAPGAGATPATKDVQNALPRWVEKVESAGRASAAAPVNVRIYLAPNGGVNALKSAVAAVSTPGSPSYRAFLSAADFHNRYDPTKSTVKAVSTWLRQNKFTVTGVESHRRYVSAHGTVAAAQKAFGAGVTTRNRAKGGRVQADSAPLGAGGPGAVDPDHQRVKPTPSSSSTARPRHPDSRTRARARTRTARSSPTSRPTTPHRCRSSAVRPFPTPSAATRSAAAGGLRGQPLRRHRRQRGDGRHHRRLCRPHDRR